MDDVGAVVNADTDVIVDVDVIVGVVVVYIFAAAVILQILHKVWSEVDPSPGRQQSHVALSRPSASASSTIKASATSSLQAFRVSYISHPSSAATSYSICDQGNYLKKKRRNYQHKLLFREMRWR